MKKWPAIVIGAVDAALLLIILISVITGWRIGAPKTPSDNTHLQPIVSATEKSVSATEAVRQTEASDNHSSTDPQQKSEPTEKPAEKPKQIQTEVPKASYPSADEIGTSEGPTLSDIQGFKWNKDDGAYWELLTSSATKLPDFDVVTGGWKAYILDDPSGKRMQYSTEHFANIRLSGSDSVAKATIDWIYVTATDEGDGHDDTSPDSVFNGEWSDGTFSGLGSGKLTLYDFYYEKGKEYGVGEYIWPDGVESIVALVRP